MFLESVSKHGQKHAQAALTNESPQPHPNLAISKGKKRKNKDAGDPRSALINKKHQGVPQYARNVINETLSFDPRYAVVCRQHPVIQSDHIEKNYASRP